MKDQRPYSERIIWSIKNNRILAYIIVFGSIVIALGIFTDATKKIIEFMKTERPEEARAKLAQMNLLFEPDTFLKCVEKGDLTATKLFLAANIDPNVTYPDGTSALMIEAAKGRTPLLDALLKAGADVDKKTYYGKTALSVAAVKGKQDTLNLLLDEGANRETRNGALPKAASAGHIEILQILIDRGVDADALDQAFVEAAGREEVNVLSFLLQKGAEVRKIGAQAFTKAAQSDHMKGLKIDDRKQAETITYLLDLGINVDTPDEEDWTAVCHASWDRNISSLKVLINRGANLNWICRGYGGETPLTSATSNRSGTSSLEFVQYLLEKGADPNLKDPDGSTALIHAVSGDGNTAIIHELLKAGADPQEKNAKGKTAAEIAKETWLPDKRNEILQLLKEYDDKKGI